MKSISRRARVLILIGLGALALVACTPEEQALWDLFVEKHQAELDLIAQHTAGGPSDAVLARLRMCESNGNYQAVSRSGRYRGAYQFSRSTWNSTAAGWLDAYVSVDPAQAAPHIQDAMARKLWKHAGSSPWPHCGPKAA